MRLPSVLVTWLLALLAFGALRVHYGRRTGAVAAAGILCSPAVLIHGGLATADPFAALAAVPVEQPVHLETLRHVITACKATGGNRAVATSMRRGCERVRAELAHEAGTAPATTCVQRAVASTLRPPGSGAIFEDLLRY